MIILWVYGNCGASGGTDLPIKLHKQRVHDSVSLLLGFGDQPIHFGKIRIGNKFVHCDSSPIIVTIRSVTPFSSASISSNSRGGVNT